MKKDIIEALQQFAPISDETAQDIIDQRKALKVPLTARAARVFSKEFAQCPDIEAAVDWWVDKGYRGFKAEWVLNPNRSTRKTTLSAGMDWINEPTGETSDSRNAQLLLNRTISRH